MDADICYLLLVPFRPRAPLGPLELAPAQKDAPYFFDLDIEFRSAGERQMVVEDTSINIRLQVLDEQVWVAECRYRLLDRTIERSLRALRQSLASARITWLPQPNRTLQQIVEQRLALLLDFEKTDQSLLLIGDWYSARVYRLIVEQFDLMEWKATVSAKLDSLAAIDGIVRQDLAFSWRRLLDIIQFVGWFVMFVGYFVLFVHDLSRYR